MRRYEVWLCPQGGWAHPFERVIQEKPYVERVAIHKIRLITDDLGLMLYEFSGDFERTRALMSELLGELGYQINEFDGRIFVYSLLLPNETVRALLRIPRDFEVFLDPPMTYSESGELLVTYISTEESFNRAISTIPDDVTVRLERKRNYDPPKNTFLSTLTDRQQEIFETAIDLGYYGSPRGATYEDIGEAVGLSSGTIGEHLRKIEAKLVEYAVPERVGGIDEQPRID